MWYVPIFALMALTIYCYRRRRVAARFPDTVDGPLAAFLANDATIILLATLTLAAVIFLLRGLAPGGVRYKETRAQGELVARQLLTRYLALKLVPAATMKAKALVIDRAADVSDPWHQAALTGLREGFVGKQVEIVASHLVCGVPADTPARERVAAAAGALTVRELDELLRKYAECTIIICLVDLPPDYSSSQVCDLARRRKLVFGLAASNIYLLGEAIDSSGITGCAVPKRVFQYDQPPTLRSEAEAAFDQRFLWVDSSNVLDVARQNKSLLWRSKRI